MRIVYMPAFIIKEFANIQSDIKGLYSVGIAMRSDISSAISPYTISTTTPLLN